MQAIDERYEPVDRQIGSKLYTDVGTYHIPQTSVLTGLLWGFANHPELEAQVYYFWRIADELWNHDELPEKKFVRHEWADLMIREALQNKYLSIGGSSSSGKSHTMAGLAIVFWLADPAHTLVLLTSTTLQAARKRIWGSVVDLLSVIENAPIKLRDSIGAANYINPKGKVIDRAGLVLVAAEKSRTREAVGKFIGIKQKRVMVVGDELSEISESIVHAALSNLSNNPTFRFCGLSNPDSRFDAFGVWSTPKQGWESIDAQFADEWETKWGGKYIRLDGERSPNILAGEWKYKWMPAPEKVEEDKKLLGEKSRMYMRMVRAIFFEADEAEGIYSEVEIISGGAMRKNVVIKNGERLAALDPAFTQGGDTVALVFGTLGTSDEGRWVLRADETIPIFDDATDKDTPRSHQIAKQVRAECERRGVPCGHLAIDATAGGEPFCDVMADVWPPGDFLRVQFGGKASKKKVSQNSRQRGHDLYVNRVSELWYVGKEFIRAKQIAGLESDAVKQMTQRRYDIVKGSSARVRVEPKKNYKARIGSSPDEADAFFILLELARARFGFTVIDPVEGSRVQRTGLPVPKRDMRALDVAGRSGHAFLEKE